VAPINRSLLAVRRSALAVSMCVRCSYNLTPRVLMDESAVLRMSMAMVMGPTPPGTGVIMDATFLADAKSTSPTKRKPAFLLGSMSGLVPTSMMTAPGLTHAPWMTPNRLPQLSHLPGRRGPV
jgi:hypothetical protein